MRSSTWARWAAVGATCTASFVAFRPEAEAAKPGGGGGTSPDGGFVWFLESGAMTRMRADGSAKTPLTAVPGSSVTYRAGTTDCSDEHATIDVSRAPHGPAGEHWLLFVLPVLDGLASPAGVPHHEVFAIREDGARAQLTDGTVTDADGRRRIAVEPDCVRVGAAAFRITAAPSFSRSGSREDGRVTYVARAWTAEGFPTDPGLYGVGVDLAAPSTSSPARLAGVDLRFRQYAGALPWTSWTAAVDPAIHGSHDWSSDGETVVWECVASGGISSTSWDAGGNATTAFLRAGSRPMLPQVNGATGAIVYVGWDTAAGKGEVRTMLADGSADRVLVAAPASSGKSVTGLWPPTWSPSGTWVAYGSWSRSLSTMLAKSDVLQVPGSGGSTLNPTSAGSDYAVPVAWRN